MRPINRRHFLGGSLVAASGGLLPSVAAAQKANNTPPAEAAARSFRFVHFGDTHYGHHASLAAAASPNGYPGALRQVHTMEDRPDFILHTGDIITDAFWATPDSAQTQWDAYDQVMREHCTLPVHYTIGNHDVNFGWGWDESLPYPGKAMVLERTGLARPYYSFDHKGWHFIVLDNNQKGGYNGFTHHIDPTQLAWLEADLDATDPDTPIVISSHAPILTVTCFFCPSNKEHPDGLVIPNDWVHTDVDALHRLLRKHGNVKLCLSGHFHAVDHVEYLGIHHICGGAVCADYWRKPLSYAPEHEAGFGVVDLFDNGGFEYRYVDYGLVGFQDSAERERYPWEDEKPFVAH
ncbi:MAG: metallophosphoesterase [Phycisphaerales bacterium JB063]